MCLCVEEYLKLLGLWGARVIAWRREAAVMLMTRWSATELPIDVRPRVAFRGGAGGASSCHLGAAF